MKHPFTLGSMRGWVIRDGARSFPAAHFFDKAAMASFEIDEDYEMEFSLNCLLLETSSGFRILIDTGVGRNVGGNEGRLFLGLKQAGVPLDTVNMVILTHGHWDHIGGLLSVEGDERFPNARVLLPHAEWEFWTDAEKLEKMDGPVRTWAEDILPPFSGRIETFEPGDKILDSVTALNLAGHTVGQCGLRIESDGELLLVIADAIHQPFQFKAPQHSPEVDIHQQQSTKNRQRLVDQILAQNALIAGYHFPYPGLGRISMGAEGVEWAAVAAL